MFDEGEFWTSSEVSKLTRVLYRRSEQLERLLHRLPLGIAVIDAESNCTYANRAFRLQHPDMAALISRIREEFQISGLVRRAEASFRVDPNLTVTALRHEDGTMTLVSTPESKSDAAEAAAEEPAPPSLDAIAFVEAPVLVVSGSMQITIANHAAAEFLGYPLQELLSLSYRSLDADTVLDDLAATASVQAVLRHRTGTQIPVELRVRTAASASGTVRVLTILPQSPVATADASTMATLERVAGQIAHRLNNLLTVILSYTELIQSDYGSVESLGSELAKIREAAVSASRITQDLLTFSRGRPVATVLVEVDRAVASMASLFRSLAGSSAIRIVPNAPDVQVRFGLKELETVLMHLVKNAREAMGEAAGTITIQTARLDPAAPESRHLLAQAGLPGSPSDYVRISVIDNGPGFAPEHQTCLFEPFFTTKRGALGMGLPVSYGMLKRAGGGLVLERAPSGGCKATVVLPATTPVET